MPTRVRKVFYSRCFNESGGDDQVPNACQTVLISVRLGITESYILFSKKPAVTYAHLRTTALNGCWTVPIVSKATNVPEWMANA